MAPKTILEALLRAALAGNVTAAAYLLRHAKGPKPPAQT